MHFVIHFVCAGRISKCESWEDDEYLAAFKGLVQFYTACGQRNLDILFCTRSPVDGTNVLSFLSSDMTEEA